MLDRQFKHGIGIIHKLNSEIFLLKYQINECKLKVWMYLDRESEDELLAIKISQTMSTKGEIGKMRTYDIEVLNSIIKRFQELSGKLKKKKNLLRLHFEAGGDVNVDKVISNLL